MKHKEVQELLAGRLNHALGEALIDYRKSIKELISKERVLAALNTELNGIIMDPELTFGLYLSESGEVPTMATATQFNDLRGLMLESILMAQSDV